jgi:hypothetical protein
MINDSLKNFISLQKLGCYSCHRPTLALTLLRAPSFSLTTDNRCSQPRPAPSTSHMCHSRPRCPAPSSPHRPIAQSIPCLHQPAPSCALSRSPDLPATRYRSDPPQARPLALSQQATASLSFCWMNHLC